MYAMEKVTNLEIDNVFYGWENYPLGSFGCDPVEVDLGTYHARLHGDISRLVGDSTEIEALTVEHSRVDAKGVKTLKNTIRNIGDFESYLMGRVHSTSTFLSVKPVYSFGELLISEEILKKLLTYFKVLPGFLDILHTFGGKVEEKDEDFGIYRQYITKDAPGPSGCYPNFVAFELCYNLKHVEQRQDNCNPGRSLWATRKMGIYSKYYPSTNSTAWILLQPSAHFLRRVEEVFVHDAGVSQKDLKRRHDCDIHLLALQSANQNWTPYINSLEQDFKAMEKKALVELEDTQRIQRLKDKFLQLSHALDINHGVVFSLRRGLRNFQEQGRNIYANEAEFHKYDESLESYLLQTIQHKNRVENLIRRTDGLLSLIPYMFARRENSIMLKLSEKGTQYARSMKVITIFTMVYLPPSFVASFFGIQLFNRGPKNSLKLAPEVLYYFLVTGILMLLTFGTWIWWERRSARKTPDSGAEKV